MSWSADSLSCVIFSPPWGGGQPDALQSWTRIFNASPQGLAQNPGGFAPGGQATGLVGSYRATVVTQPGRLEFVLSPADTNTSGPAVIDDVADALSVLRAYAQKLLEQGGVVRLGLIMNLSRRASSASAAAEEFRQETHLAIRPDATDLNFGLNVPTPLKEGEGQINRICRWGTGQHQLIQLHVTPFFSSDPPVAEVFHAVTLQADLNTAPRQAPFSLTETPKIFDQLVLEAREVLARAYDYLSPVDETNV